MLLNCQRYVFIKAIRHHNSSIKQSHTGSTLAKAFQTMLEEFGVEEKIHTMNGDNAKVNDKQTTDLSGMNNTFEEGNRVRCFNHTLQLSAMTLIRPFNAGMTPQKDSADNDGDGEGGADDFFDLAEFEDEDDDGNVDESPEQDNVSDNIDELDALNAAERKALLADTIEVRTTVSKVSNATSNLHIELTLPRSSASSRSRSFGLRLLPFRHGNTPANNVTSRSS